MEDPIQGPSNINTGGGAAVGGAASAGGDFVGRDKFTINLDLRDGVDLAKVLEVLKSALPGDDHTAEHLLSLVTDFSRLHTLLFACKELHNALNDIIVALDPYRLYVERIFLQRRVINSFDLDQNWRPVRQKIKILLDFSSTASPIIPQPFAVMETGRVGPDWAIDIHTNSRRTDDLLNLKKPDPAELFDAVCDLDDAVERHMYLADKRLRDTTNALYVLTENVLRSLGHEHVS